VNGDPGAFILAGDLGLDGSELPDAVRASSASFRTAATTLRREARETIFAAWSVWEEEKDRLRCFTMIIRQTSQLFTPDVVVSIFLLNLRYRSWMKKDVEGLRTLPGEDRNAW
jgi:hypothetical protein